VVGREPVIQELPELHRYLELSRQPELRPGSPRHGQCR
jgi:hypothetical protein